MDNQNFVAFGKPGSGKSTFLKNEILRDIEHDDRAVIYLDPHGHDALDLLNAIPRRRQVIYLDAGDPDYAVGFNALDAPHRMTSALKTIFKDSWGPRLEQGLRHALAAIIESGRSLHDICPLFYDKTHRAKILQNVSNPITLRYWLELFPKAYNERQQQEAASPIYNKVDAILASHIARHLTQRHPKLDFKDVLENRKIVIVNLAAPTVGDDAALVLGSLFTTTFRNALMSTPHPASFFADEFQTYGTDVYLSMLRELRKFGLKLGLATQTAQGIDPTFLSIILGTVKDTILFNISYEDAALLAKPYATTFSDITTDLANLPPFTAYVNGLKQEMPAFVSLKQSAGKLIRNSRERYAHRMPMVGPPLAPQAHKRMRPRRRA